MIDYIKISLPRSCENALRSQLSFTCTTRQRKGQNVSRVETASFHGIVIRIIRGVILISGSLHKFYNSINGNGSHNYNDFTYWDIRDAIDFLSKELSFDPRTAQIQNLEFGVNIVVDRPAEEILRGKVVYHHWKPPARRQIFRGKGYFMEFEHSRYFLKIYDKSKQYGLVEHILRCEVKTRKSAEITSMGIMYLSDLLSKDTYLKLKDLLLTRLDQLLVIDNLDFYNIMSPEQAQFMSSMTNHCQLANLRERYSTKTMQRYKRQVINLIELYHLDHLHRDIISRVKSKISYLVDLDNVLV